MAKAGRSNGSKPVHTSFMEAADSRSPPPAAGCRRVAPARVRAGGAGGAGRSVQGARALPRAHLHRPARPRAPFGPPPRADWLRLGGAGRLGAGRPGGSARQSGGLCAAGAAAALWVRWGLALLSPGARTVAALGALPCCCSPAVDGHSRRPGTLSARPGGASLTPARRADGAGHGARGERAALAALAGALLLGGGSCGGPR